MDTSTSINTNIYTAAPAYDANEHEICKKRGHTASWVSYSDNFHTWWSCRWCGIQFRYGDPELIERDPNQPSWGIDPNTLTGAGSVYAGTPDLPTNT